MCFATYLKSFFVHGYLSLEACEIEVVLDELFRDFGEVFMADQSTEA